MIILDFIMMLAFSVCWYAGLYRLGHFFNKRDLDGVGYVVSVLYIFITAVTLMGGFK